MRCAAPLAATCGAAASHAFGDRLRLDAVGELGATPYARLDGVRAPESQLGGHLLVALSAVTAR